MALEHWELVQRSKGNIAGAEIARVLREQYGDEPYDNEPTDSITKPIAKPETREDRERTSNEVSLSLKEMGVPTRVAHAVERAIYWDNIGARSIEDLSKTTDLALSRIRNLGPHGVRKLRSAVPYQPVVPNRSQQ